MGLVETEAVILRTHKLAEADKIVVCLTKDAGVVRGVARGARRLKSRFGASLEPFTLVALSYFVKEGRELVSIRHAEIQRSYFGLAQNAETVAALEYLCELALEFAPPQDPNEKIFRMVKASLQAIAAHPQRVSALARYYELWILKLSGFLPDVRSCARCRRAFDSTEPVNFGPESAVRCENCAEGFGLRVSGEARAQWRQMQRLAPEDWAREMSQATLKSQQELAQVTHSLITRALERTPRGHTPLEVSAV